MPTVESLLKGGQQSSNMKMGKNLNLGKKSVAVLHICFYYQSRGRGGREKMVT